MLKRTNKSGSSKPPTRLHTPQLILSWYPSPARVFHAGFTPVRPQIEFSTPIFFYRLDMARLKRIEAQGRNNKSPLSVGGGDGSRRRIKHQSATCRATRSVSSRLLSSRAVSLLFCCPPPTPFRGAVSSPLSVLVARLVARSWLSPASSLCQAAMNLAAPFATPAFHCSSPCTFAASAQLAFGTSKTRDHCSLPTPSLRHVLRHACVMNVPQCYTTTSSRPPGPSCSGA